MGVGLAYALRLRGIKDVLQHFNLDSGIYLSRLYPLNKQKWLTCLRALFLLVCPECLQGS